MFDEIKNCFLNELVSNSFEHGGEFILYSVRIGDVTVQTRREGPKDQFEYRREFFDYCSNYGTKFIEVLVMDSGPGIYETLLNSYIEEKIKTRKVKYKKTSRPETIQKEIESKPRKRQIVHRYALSPLSSCKDRPDPLYTSGLGVISQHVINGYATLAIKDQSDVTFFNPRNCKNRASMGSNESKSVASYKTTLVNLLVPVFDEEWLKRNGKEVIRPVGHSQFGDLADYQYVLIRQPLQEVELHFGHASDSSGKFLVDHLACNQDGVLISQVEQFLGENPKPFIVLDFASHRVARKKSWWIPLIRCMDECIEKGSTPILVNVDIASFRMLQTLVDTTDSDESFKIKRSLFCLMVSDSFDVFWCCLGDTKELRPMLNDYLRTGVVSKKIAELLASYGVSHEKQINLKKVDELLHIHRGKSLTSKVLNNDTFHKRDVNVFTSDEQWTGSYYGTRQLISSWSFVANYLKDIKRVVSRDNYDLIIVDCTELASALRAAQRQGWRRSLEIVRSNGMFLENVSKCRSAKRILLLPSTVRTLETTRGLLANANSLLIDNIVAVNPLFDLRTGEGLDRDIFANEFEIEYRPFVVLPLAKANPTGEKFFATTQASLIPWVEYEASSKPVFEPILRDADKYQLLQEENLLVFDHRIEAGHHHDLFLDVRNALTGNHHLTYVFIRELLEIALDSDVVVYPRQSEMSHVLSLAKHNRKMRRIEIAKIDSSKSGWAVLSGAVGDAAVDIEKRRILLVDEGAYTWSTLVSCIREILRQKPASLKILVLEVRTPDGAAMNSLRELIQSAEIDVQCLGLIKLDVPVFSKADCPICHCGFQIKNSSNVLGEMVEVDDIKLTTVAGAALWAFEKLSSGRSGTEQLVKVLGEHTHSYAAIVFLKCLLLRFSQLQNFVTLRRFIALVENCYEDARSPRRKLEILETAISLNHPYQPVIKEKLLLLSTADIEKPDIQEFVTNTLRSDKFVAKQFFQNVKGKRLGPTSLAGKRRKILNDISRICTPPSQFPDIILRLLSDLGYFTGDTHETIRTRLLLVIEGKPKGEFRAFFRAFSRLVQTFLEYPISYQISNEMKEVVSHLKQFLDGRLNSINELLDLLYRNDSPIRTFLTVGCSQTLETTISKFELASGAKALVPTIAKDKSLSKIHLFVSSELLDKFCQNLNSNLMKNNRENGKIDLALETSGASWTFKITNYTDNEYETASYNSGNRFLSLKNELQNWFLGSHYFRFDRDTKRFTTIVEFRKLFHVR